jgi:hypothetical protein
VSLVIEPLEACRVLCAGSPWTKNPQEPDEISTPLDGNQPYAELTVRGAFVVQVWKATQDLDGEMEGVVEVVDTGNQFHFRSEAELIRYLRNRFIETCQSSLGKEETK